MKTMVKVQELMRIVILLILVTFNLSASSLLDTTYSFKNISVNHLDWSDDTEKNTKQKDFSYIEFEAGFGFSWGDIYIFGDIENPTKSYDDNAPNDQRYVVKPVINITLVDKLSLYLQDYILRSKTFNTNDLVVGLSYKINTEFGFSATPFAGVHYKKSTYFNNDKAKLNGYMLGWSMQYHQEIAKQKFSITQWHEFEIDREKEEYDAKLGTQGALSVWWHPISEISTGLQYRYAKNNLGSTELQNAIIYSLKYNFIQK